MIPKLLKQGLRGSEVVFLQKLLSFAANQACWLDGAFGANTALAVKDFQLRHGLVSDGIVGAKTWLKLLEYNTKDKFVVFADAGHGDYHNGVNYTDPKSGKFAHHPTLKLHDGKGWYYEGHENRIIANEFANEAKKMGVVVLKTYDAHKDTSLQIRAAIVKSWVLQGHYGYLHSFHSNASPTNKNTDKFRGFSVFTTVGQTQSDYFAAWHYDESLDEFGKDFVWRRGDMTELGKDYEANFAIMLWTEKFKEGSRFGAFLEEFGFHTSKKDTEFITNPETRKRRVVVALRTLDRIYSWFVK